MSEQNPIDRFVSSLRRRLNRFRLFDCLIWGAGIGALVLLLVSLLYVLRGHAVPGEWQIALPLAALAAGLLAWGFARRDDEATARFADDFFGLKDALSSYLHFRRQRRGGAVYELQERATAAQVGPLAAAQVVYHWPRRLIALVCGLALACTMLAFKEASPEVVERLRVEEETAAKSGEINAFLEELVEEWEADGEDPADLDPERVREWVAELKGTKDRDEALRQYAELERRMQEAAKRLDPRRNEHLLAKAGEELRKAEESEPRSLGRKLEEKRFREAEEDLAKMQPEEVDPERLDERRKELAKLKSAAQRMAAAAQAAGRSAGTGAAKAAGQEEGGASKGGASGSPGGGADGSGGQGGGSGGEEGLDGLLTRLDESVRRLDGSLGRAAQEKRTAGQCSAKSLGQCRSDRDAVLSDLRKLGECLQRTASRSERQAQLLAMCQKLGQCQGYLCESKFASLGQCMGQGQGKGIGAGSVDSRREGESEPAASGQMSQVQGIKGDGPSETTVEAADDGDGVSTLRSPAREREFRQQMESFVRRDDVPDAVKDGVKEYFQRIHRAE